MHKQLTTPTPTHIKKMEAQGYFDFVVIITKNTQDQPLSFQQPAIHTAGKQTDHFDQRQLGYFLYTSYFP